MSCRASAGECDAIESCDGVAHTCPDDLLAPNGAPCAMGVCLDGACTDDGAGARGGANGGNGGTGGIVGTGGSAGAAEPPASDDGGCGCELPGRQHPRPQAGWLLAVLGLGVTARRRYAQ